MASNERALPVGFSSRAGKLAPGVMWLFALGAAALAVGAEFLTVKAPNWVQWGVFAAIFVSGGFCGGYFTRASKGLAVLGMAAATLPVMGIYYWQASAAAAFMGAFGSLGGSAMAASASKATIVVLLPMLAIALAVLLATGIGAALTGVKMREKA